ncbi:hypothetical protein Droror1_Dr00025678 [Drosera rotundifolia]
MIEELGKSLLSKPSCGDVLSWNLGFDPWLVLLLDAGGSELGVGCSDELICGSSSSWFSWPDSRVRLGVECGFVEIGLGIRRGVCGDCELDLITYKDLGIPCGVLRQAVLAAHLVGLVGVKQIKRTIK